MNKRSGIIYSPSFLKSDVLQDNIKACSLEWNWGSKKYTYSMCIIDFNDIEFDFIRYINVFCV